MKEIIINKMYVGDYLLTADNIGHEIINLYKADDGNNYIYLCPSGRVDKSHTDNEITILLTRKFDTGIYKIVAKAEGVNILDIATKDYIGKDFEKTYQAQKELGITYAGIGVEELFKNNTYHGVQGLSSCCATFRAKTVIKPKKPIFITDNKSLSDESNGIYYIETKKGFARQALRQFFNEINISFKDLENIIKSDLWEEKDTTKKASEILNKEFDEHFSFINIVKQEDSELAFSNMLAYFLNKNKKAAQKFASEILEVSIDFDFTLEREKHNIDLLLTDNFNVVVIENKIKSSINGLSEDSRHNLYGELVQSQLNKYYEIVTTQKEYADKKPHFYIFSPNYNRIDIKKFSKGQNYKIIYYSEIYKFFYKNKEFYKDIAYFNDFINALHKHTKEYDDSLEIEMQRRFINAIKNN